MLIQVILIFLSITQYISLCVLEFEYDFKQQFSLCHHVQICMQFAEQYDLINDVVPSQSFQGIKIISH